METGYRAVVGLSVAGVVAFGGNALDGAIAAAEPNDLVFDVEAYDDCMNKTVRDANQCCVDAGGVPTDEPLDNEKGQKCAAPPAESAGQQTLPPSKLPPGIVAPIGPAQIQGDPGVPPRPLPDRSAPVVTLVPTG